MKPETFEYAKYGFWMAFIGVGLCQFCMLYICVRACCCSKINESTAEQQQVVANIPMNQTESVDSNKKRKQNEPPPSYA